MDKALASVLIFFLAVNVLAFFIMFLDKRKSKKASAERISEGMLFFIATAFGSVGVYAGMFVFHHKTQKWYFLLGIPLLILQNATLLYFIKENIGAF
ncbi:MAG: DUF1294 domain-containing protein [Candidatus Moranbacteria bacterium]|nr:DUF1294 domain-containing protein [Candidatus Moranbacteria bacterium]